MPHKLLADYLKFVEQAILNCKTAYVERYIEDILTPERVNLRIRIRFQQGHLLEINEAVEVVKNKLTSLDYRYHCQFAKLSPTRATRPQRERVLHRRFFLS